MIRHQWITALGTFDLRTPDPETIYAGVMLTNKGIEGMGNPPHRSFTEESAQLDGQTNTGWKAKPRPVFWPIVINSTPDNWDETQTTWWQTMRPNLYGTWRVLKDDDSYRDLTIRYVDDGGSVYPIDPSLDGFEVHGITLVADDPWWKGPEISETFQTAEDELPFFAVTADRVLNLMSSNTVANASIYNPGDAAAWPVFRLDGPITSFEIAQYDLSGVAGAQISSTTIEVEAGDYLIIDTNPTAQTATLFPSGGGSENVTDQLEVAMFFTVPANDTQAFYVVLNGSGSLTVSIVPNYYRAL